MQNLPFSIQVSPEVTARYPTYRALVLVANHLQNGPSTPFTDQLLADVEADIRQRFDLAAFKAHPHMQAWREAYRLFGVKPQKLQNSAEALITRVLKGQNLPRINLLVDLYNAISVRHVLPSGGEDLSQVEGEVCLKFASGTEPFDTVKDGQHIIEYPQQGEVVWTDARGVTCRAWNWRQGTRTRLTEQATSVYFLLDHLMPEGPLELQKAGAELIALLQKVCPEVQISEHWLGVESL